MDRMLSTSGLRSDYFWKVLLIIYFVGLIAISIAAIIRIWNPAPEVTVQTTTNNATITFGSPSIKDLVASRENYLIIINALFGVLGGSTYVYLQLHLGLPPINLNEAGFFGISQGQ